MVKLYGTEGLDPTKDYGPLRRMISKVLRSPTGNIVFRMSVPPDSRINTENVVLSPEEREFVVLSPEEARLWPPRHNTRTNETEGE